VLTDIRCVGVMQKGKVEILVNDQGTFRIMGAANIGIPN
jgi:hypothetical protein